uniref:CWH43-like N-terminal domain-containing protein n=1 Tax=Meloidogyne enterolobii TaxID=390850 RepID=A0A6V7TK87_MELEN|nr:unnamed protein product [Meloidogyne enterolobii]
MFLSQKSSSFFPSSTFSSSSSSSSSPPPTTSSSFPSSSLFYSSKLIYLIKFKQIIILTILPPLFGILIVIALAILFHSEQIFGYEWTCGITYLPSISRILNLPAERIVWNFLILLHIPLRLLIILHIFFSFSKQKLKENIQIIQKSNVKFITRKCLPKITPNKYLQIVYLISGLFDNLFLSSLSVVGEREHSELHVIFFSFYLFSIFINFSVHFYLELNLLKNKKKSQKFHFIFLFLLFLLIPFIIFFFSINQLYCIKFSYEIFVFIEYLIVFCIFCFNFCILFENHKNCFFLFFY